MELSSVEKNVHVEYAETLKAVQDKNTEAQNWNSQPPIKPDTPVPVSPTLPEMEVLLL